MNVGKKLEKIFRARSLDQATVRTTIQLPGPNRLEGLLRQCDSGFEREVLHKMVATNIPLPDKAQYKIYDGDRPVAKPDFFYILRNIAVFVDGPPHDKDYVKKDDETKRNELEALGYRVFSISHDNVEGGLKNLKDALT